MQFCSKCEVYWKCTVCSQNICWSENWIKKHTFIFTGGNVNLPLLSKYHLLIHLVLRLSGNRCPQQCWREKEVSSKILPGFCKHRCQKMLEVSPYNICSFWKVEYSNECPSTELTAKGCGSFILWWKVTVWCSFSETLSIAGPQGKYSLEDVL